METQLLNAQNVVQLGKWKKKKSVEGNVTELEKKKPETNIRADILQDFRKSCETELQLISASEPEIIKFTHLAISLVFNRFLNNFSYTQQSQVK